MSKRSVSVPVYLSLASILLSIGCTDSSQSNVSDKTQNDPAPSANALVKVSTAGGTALKYGGKSMFFEGADQYKVTFCEDEACQKTLEAGSVTLEAKIAKGSSVIKQANALFEKFLYRESSAASIDFNLRTLSVNKAIAVVEDPNGTETLGEAKLDEAAVAKVRNYLKKNDPKIKVYLVEFFLKFEGGDASESYLAIYNADSGWVTYIQIATYVE
jgi:hypothetical protein